MHPMLNVAVKAARRAGAVINRATNDLDKLIVERKGPSDFVSEVDRAAENTIIDTIRETVTERTGVMLLPEVRAVGPEDA